VDNSLAAGASEVYIDIHPKEGSRPACIVIADNGKGMDRATLHESMRFGAEKDYSGGDLGKYGLGLKTASLSQCRVLTVASKPKPERGARSRRSIMRWDLDYIDKHNDWNLLVPEVEELKQWEQELLEQPIAGDHGTVVLWSNLDEALPLLSSGDESKKQRFLVDLLEEVSSHLRMVFHRFMQNKVPGRKKLTLRVGENRLKAWDPFCISEEKTQSLDPKTYTVSIPGHESSGATEKVIVSPYILPAENQFSSREAWKDASGPRNWNFQQGFYFYRNGRLLQAGGWSYIRSVDEHTKLLRVAVDFDTDLDSAFAINVTKMKAKIPDDIWDTLKSDVSKWAQAARSVYDKKDPKAKAAKGARGAAAPSPQPASPNLKIGGITVAMSNAPGSKVTVSDAGSGGMRLVVPYDHEAARLFDKKQGRQPDFRNLCLILFGLVEAIAEKRLKPSDIQMNTLRKALQKLL
jgi:hypothetical protein